jgi:hypothetical protein
VSAIEAYIEAYKGFDRRDPWWPVIDMTVEIE